MTSRTRSAVLLSIVSMMASTAIATDYANNTSVQLFQQYIQIDTTSNGDLTPAVEFWKKLANNLNLEVEVLEFVSGMPIVVITWPGSDDSLPAIVLNSHMDVVPAVVADWTYDPFSGYLDENNDIYGRGTQDMKSVSIQYFEALKRITQTDGKTLKRTVYMTLMPDEEIGGLYGMSLLVESGFFTDRNVGCLLDEGGPTTLPAAPVLYNDKSPWHIKVDCYGEAVHGSTLPDINATAIGQCKNFMELMFRFREEQYQIAVSAPAWDAGGYTSVNLNIVSGGTANNIIPNVVSFVYDVRLAVDVDEDEFEAQLNAWAAEAGSNVVLTYLLKSPQTAATRVDLRNPYWVAFTLGLIQHGLIAVPTIPSGATDARYVRSDSISAFGYSPMPSTELLLHTTNEHLSAATFLKGIDIYESIITRLGNLS